MKNPPAGCESENPGQVKERHRATRSQSADPVFEAHGAHSRKGIASIKKSYLLMDEGFEQEEIASGRIAVVAVPFITISRRPPAKRFVAGRNRARLPD